MVNEEGTTADYWKIKYTQLLKRQDSIRPSDTSMSMMLSGSELLKTKEILAHIEDIHTQVRALTFRLKDDQDMRQEIELSYSNSIR